MIDHRWTFNASLVRVVDGDTLKLAVDLGFRHYTIDNYRLDRIDAPEKTGASKAAGLSARDWVQAELQPHEEYLLLKASKHGKFRWIVEIYYDRDLQGEYHKNLSDELVKAGHAVYRKF